MKIISWNTNGLRATVKQGYFIPLFAFNNPDIVCLQETKCEPYQLDESTRDLNGYHSYFSSSKTIKGYSGVAIYSKIEPDKVEYGIGIKEFDDEGRFVIAYYKNFVLINCYFPNGGLELKRMDYKMKFYDAFLNFVDKLRSENNSPSRKASARRSVIFCGDVNTAHQAIDLARPDENVNHTGFLPIERAWMDKVEKDDWIDIFRYLYPNKKDVYTFWDQKTRARDRNIGWRIDYFFLDKSFIKKIKGFKTLSDYFGSDHCPIEIDIK